MSVAARALWDAAPSAKRGYSGCWAQVGRAHPGLPGYLCGSCSCFAVPPSLPADPTRIRLSSSVEVNYWCQTLNCTETRLRNAVLAVGILVADVRAYLAR